MPNDSLDRLRETIVEVPDFPAPGVLFRDITPLLAEPAVFADAIARMADPVRGLGITHVLAIESRGFLLGAPLALTLSASLVPLRKPGKLPRATVRTVYSLEYGSDTLEMHADAVDSQSRVLIVDDVLATGGTLAAALQLVQQTGAIAVASTVLIELPALDGRARLAEHPVYAVLTY
jgi:adenine phosphoribosyltransferase